MTVSTDIHYIWTGFKPQATHLGHDTIGPDLTREALPDANIYFWCFDSEVPRYQAYFDRLHGKQNIKVQGIESYVLAKDTNTYRAIVIQKGRLPRRKIDNSFIRLIETLKTNAHHHACPNDKIREYITIKDAFQYFLQIHQSGYFLDTNIIPNPNFKASLPEVKAFSFPLIESENKPPQADPWLMCSPTGDCYAQNRFIRYYKEAFKECHERDHLSHIDRRRLGNAFVDTAVNSPNSITLLTKRLGQHKDVVDIGFFRKRYSNTHRRPKDIGLKRPPLLQSVVQGEPSYQELRYHLEQNCFDPTEPYYQEVWVNTPSKQQKKITIERTLVKVAIDDDKVEALRILLEYVSTKKQSASISLWLNCAMVQGSEKTFDYLFQRLIDSLSVKETTLISQVNFIIALLKRREYIEERDSPIKTLDALKKTLFLSGGSDAISFIRMGFLLFSELGPINERNLNDYRKRLKRPSTGLFFRKKDHEIETILVDFLRHQANNPYDESSKGPSTDLPSINVTKLRENRSTFL